MVQSCSICGERHAASGCRLPMLVSLVVDDAIVTQQYSFHNLRKTLRLAWELIGGIPQAYCGVWYKGRRLAELETDWKGQLEEASVMAERGGHILVTPLNPAGPIFTGVFAE